MMDNSGHGSALDINEAFRSGGRAVEFLDQINKAVDDLEHGRILGRGIITYS